MYSIMFRSFVTFNDSPDPGISCDILSPFHCTNKLLVQAVTSFLNSTNSICKFTNCWVVHFKLCLQSSMYTSCFNMVVATIISFMRPLVYMALFARERIKQMSSTGRVHQR